MIDKEVDKEGFGESVSVVFGEVWGGFLFESKRWFSIKENSFWFWFGFFKKFKKGMMFNIDFLEGFVKISIGYKEF